MPSNYTQNYQLNQWEATDQVQRTDFNADNAKIDAVLAALSTATATIPKIAVGSYTGDGSTSRIINVGFTPKAVLVFPVHGRNYSNDYSGGIMGGLAVTGSPTIYSGYNAIEVVSGGFKVTYEYITEFSAVLLNHPSTTYNYIAIG